MTSCLRILCRSCAETEDKDYSTLKETGPIRKLNYKQKRKRKDTTTGTWTRRSLLMIDDADYDDVPQEEMSYQMKAIHRSQECEISSYNSKSRSNPRKTEQEVFTRNHNNTTIPNWMDESFVSNSRTATHLGIRSVQINARRNEIANRRSQDLATQSYRYSTVSSGIEREKKAISMNDLLIKRTSLNPPNITRPPSNGFNDNITPRSPRSNVSTNTCVSSAGQDIGGDFAHLKTNNLQYPLRLSDVNDNTLILKESQSDVGVRRVVTKTPGYRRSNPIPKLEDYIGGKRSSSTVGIDHTDGHTSQSHIEIMQGSYHPHGNEQTSDLSYSNNIILKKSDVSLKRDNAPALFYSSSFSNMQPKQKLASKSQSNPSSKHKTNYAVPNAGDSMYGYVPKVVRNVHASDVLEGNQIDDFFMQRMHDRELEKFASLVQDKDDTTIGIMADEDITAKRKDDMMIVTSIMTDEDITAKLKVRQTIPQNNPFTLDDTNLKFETIKTHEPHRVSASVKQVHHSQELLGGEITNWTTHSMPLKQNTMQKSTEVLEPQNSIQTNAPKFPNTEESVIMIDFPPNLENDKSKSTVSAVNMNSNNSETVAFIADHKTITSNEDTSRTKSDKGSPIQNNPDHPLKTTMDRPKITMGVSRTRAAVRADSDISTRSNQTTSAILESAEVLY